jgi:hypothetical protein
MIFIMKKLANFCELVLRVYLEHTGAIKMYGNDPT